MTLGGLFLIKSDAPYLQVSLSFLLPTVMTVGALVGIIAWMAIKTGHRRPVTGTEGMIGSIGIAKTDLNPRGQIAITRGDLGGDQPNPDSARRSRGSDLG